MKKFSYILMRRIGLAGILLLVILSAGRMLGERAEAKSIRMNRQEIRKKNREILRSNAGMHDLCHFPEALDGIELRERLSEAAQRQFQKYCDTKRQGQGYYQTNGSPVEASFFSPMIKNISGVKTQRLQPVRYGLAVRYTALRAYPTKEFLLEDPKDPDFDLFQNSSIRVNEPVIVVFSSADQNYYYVYTDSCCGWASAADIAWTTQKNQWMDFWKLPDEESLVVTDGRLYLPASNRQSESSGLLLTMGTVLRAAEGEKETGREWEESWKYARLPVRNCDGTLGQIRERIPLHFFREHRIVEGYLPMNKEKILELAYSRLGETYGWGGMLESNDCSGYIRDIFRCFGLFLARNTTNQMKMPFPARKLTDLSAEEKCSVLDTLPVGTLLYFRGHVMLYLGKEKGKYRVISAVSTLGNERVRGVVVNTLSARRANGKGTWLENLELALRIEETQ